MSRILLDLSVPGGQPPSKITKAYLNPSDLQPLTRGQSRCRSCRERRRGSWSALGLATKGSLRSDALSTRGHSDKVERRILLEP